jgi:hypothetical protein
MKKLLLLLLVSGLTGVTLAQVDPAGASRGANDDAGLKAAQRSVANQLIVEEIEGAGFEIDVVEGFDEEWEEDIWVASEADDVDANYVDPSETAKFDLEDVPHADEVDAGWTEDAWDNPEQVIEAHDIAVTVAEEDEETGAMRGEATTDVEADELMIDTDVVIDEEDEAAWEDEADYSEANWWEESSENWSAFIDEMEIEEFETDFEEEDLDLLEELYMSN